MDAFLVEALLEQARAGKKAESGFKKEAWVAVTSAVNSEFKSTLEISQIKTRSQTVSRTTRSYMPSLMCAAADRTRIAQGQVSNGSTHASGVGLWLG